ncbi:MAG: hypothetical protein AAFX50_03325, partial [Acidobacteriota bacterium]
MTFLFPFAARGRRRPPGLAAVALAGAVLFLPTAALHAQVFPSVEEEDLDESESLAVPVEAP